MLKCVIFDLDGTIANSLPLCLAGFRQSIERVTELRLSDREIIDTFGPSEEGTIQQLVPDKFDEVFAQYLEVYRELHPVICPKPFDGIPELFSLIKQRGAKLALVTGKGPRSLPITLGLFGMEDVFEHIETGRREGECKPDGIRKVLEKFGIDPDEAVYIGDVSGDIRACREVGVPVYSAAWAETADVEDLVAHHPDGIFHTVDELSAHLASLLPGEARVQ